MSTSIPCYCDNHAESATNISTSLSSRASVKHGPQHTASSASPSGDKNSQSAQPTIFCLPCVSRMLSSQIERYHSASEDRDERKRECQRRLLETRILQPLSSDDNGILSNSSAEQTDTKISNNGRQSSVQWKTLPDPNQINSQVNNLKIKLEFLQHQTAALALKVTAKRMENEEREEKLSVCQNRVRMGTERLERMKRCMLLSSVWNDEINNQNEVDSRPENSKGNEGTLIQKELNLETAPTPLPVGGGLRDALVSGRQQIQSLRFQFALKVFDMHRIDVGEQYSCDKKNNNGSEEKESKAKHTTVATGVGKISGLPLPHAGPALYGVLPPMVLASSLRLVASLTSLVARCLGVILPHPILVGEREENWPRRTVKGTSENGSEKICRCCGSAFIGAISGRFGNNTNFGMDVIEFAEDEDRVEDDVNITLDAEEFGEDDDLCDNCKRGVETSSLGPRSYSESKTSLSSSFNNVSNHTSRSSGTRSSLFSLVGSSAKKAIALATGSKTVSSSRYSATNTRQQSEGGANGALRTGNRPMHGNLTTSMNSPPRSSRNLSLSPEDIARRINHASFAVLLENHEPGAAEYVLNPPRWEDDANPENRGRSNTIIPANAKNTSHTNSNFKASNPPHQPIVNNGNQIISKILPSFGSKEEYLMAEERFSTGLQLLQNDVVALCFRAGVDASTLWPAESLLLNLDALWHHCRAMMNASNVNGH
ncbi:hypothetical protein ACHAXS_009435 [Conticribra weissflogii]